MNQLAKSATMLAKSCNKSNELYALLNPHMSKYYNILYSRTSEQDIFDIIPDRNCKYIWTVEHDTSFSSVPSYTTTPYRILYHNYDGNGNDAYMAIVFTGYNTSEFSLSCKSDATVFVNIQNSPFIHMAFNSTTIFREGLAPIYNPPVGNITKVISCGAVLLRNT